VSFLNLHPAKVKLANTNLSFSQDAIRLVNHFNTFEPFFIDEKVSENRNEGDLIALFKIGGRKFRFSASE